MKNSLTIPFLKQNDQFVSLANSSSDIVVVADVTRKILFINSTACQKSGYKKQEVVGKKIMLFFRKEDTPRYIAKISKALHETGRWTGTIEVRKKNGTTFGIEISIFEFHDDNGKPAGTISVGYDLTQQRLLVQHSLKSENELYQIFEAMEDGVSMTDSFGTVLMCNAANARMLGLSKDEIIGTTPPYPWLYSDGQEKVKHLLRILRKENKLINYHLEWKRKDNSRFAVSVSASRITGRGTKTRGYIFTIRDVSQLQYVNELQRVNERVNRLLLDIKQKAQRLQTLEEVNMLVLKNANMPQIFKSITFGIKRLVGHDLAGIYLYDVQKKYFFPHTMSKQTPFTRELAKFPLPLGEGIISTAAITGKMVLANNAQNDPRSRYPKGMKPETEHFIAVPLKGRGPLFGVLVVARYRDPEFIEEEALLVKSFAQAATVALENARLFNELTDIQEERLRTLRGNIKSADVIYRSLKPTSRKRLSPSK